MNPATDTAKRAAGEAALTRAAGGERLCAEEIVALYDAPVDEVRAVAHQRRLRLADPEAVTFSVGGNIDYTTVCNVACKFCTFYRTPRQEGAYSMSVDEVLDQLAAQVIEGVTDVIIQGGINPEIPFSWYVDLLKALKSDFPSVHIDFLSPEEIHGLEKLTGRDAYDILSELREAGMDGMPGASAEILSDDVRAQVSPARVKTADWLRIVDSALRAGVHLPSIGLVFGLGETLEHRAQHLVKLRELQDADLERGGPGAWMYKVWPMRLQDTRLNGVIPIDEDQSIIDQYLQQVAIHRLALDNVANHGCVWRTMGFETATEALRGGANEILGTGSINAVNSVMETAGKVVPRPSEPILAGVLGCISDAGFTPVQRDARYERLKTFERGGLDGAGNDYVGAFTQS
ncbi:MAG: radical SAM protein [Actinobacteria bacterium]|nr:radical SAM protein [Actinomycetota bacterium]